MPAAALLLFSLAPLWGLPFSWPYFTYYLMLYPTLLLPVPYAALVVSLRGRGTRAVLLCGGLALPLPIWAFVAISSTGYLVTLASMLLVLLAAVGLGWFRGKLRWNLLAALAGVLLSVFRMDALVRDTAWASSAPAPRPSALDIPLGRGQLHIEYRKGTQHF